MIKIIVMQPIYEQGEIMADILISSLRAHQALLSGASSNIANMNTEDYRSIRTTIREGLMGSVEAATARTETEGVPTEGGHCASNVELPQEICDLIRAQRGFEAVLGAIETREEMLDDLMAVLTR
jgi:flagellar hook protein FlgE